MARLFIFGIGGTGARVLRSLTMLLAAGVKPNCTQIVPMIIDLDTTNGDTNRAISLLETYKEIRNKTYTQTPNEGFFATDLVQLGTLKDPNEAALGNNAFQLRFGNINSTFYQFLKVQSMSAETQYLLETLFDNTPNHEPSTELNLPLDKGFKGNPNIGSIVFNDLVNTEEYKFFERTFAAGDKIFIISSIFGGTGSSGFPQLIRNIRKANNATLANAPIGALVVKPYFNVADGNGQSAIDSNNFISKTKAALSYYDSEINDKLNAIYYLYDQAKKPYENVEGGTDQRNNAHFAELVSAMSVVHFANNSPTSLEHFEYGMQAEADTVSFEHLFDGTQQQFGLPLVYFTYFSKLVQKFIPSELNEKHTYLTSLELKTRLGNSGDTYFNKINSFLTLYNEWLRELGNNQRAFKPFLLDNNFNTLINNHKVESSFFNKGLEGEYFNEKLIEIEERNKRSLPKTEERFLMTCYEVCKKAFHEKARSLPQAASSGQNYILRLHSGGTTTLRDWDRSQPITQQQISKIQDKLLFGNASKVATSIPTPFARMHLFETAFQIVANQQEGSSMYHGLVSDCLDLFQLIFDIGDSPYLKFYTWNVGNEVENLKASASTTQVSNRQIRVHELLGQTFEMYFSGRAASERLRPVSQIVLIEYKGKLVGGTSPFTLFYTSPNWKREMQAAGWKLQSITADVFFDENYEPLHRRALAFREFVHKFRNAYKEELAQFMPAFEEYIRQNAALHDRDFEKKYATYTKEDFVREYPPLTAKPNTNDYLYIGHIQLFKSKNEFEVFDSDFEIRPTVRHFAQELDENNRPQTVKPPLVLVEGNFRGWRYIQAEWQESTKIRVDVTMPLHKRELPESNGKKYPFITVADFFEPVLLKMPYNLNKDFFYTGFGAGDFNFLLPIRKLYFAFFTVADLEKQLKVSFNGNQVEFLLEIPVKKGIMRLAKVYDLNKADAAVDVDFGLGIFPFYRILDKPEINDYAMMLVDRSDKALDLRFYRAEDVMPNKALLSSFLAQDKGEQRYERTPRRGRNPSSTYLRLRKQYFDFIEVKFGDYLRGLIIPDFKKAGRELNLSNHNKQFNFAIDFGTSNTHIAYNTQQAPDHVQPFTIEKRDVQMVLLNENRNDFDEGFGGLPDLITRRDEEFVPSLIEQGRKISFPIRTATYERNSFVNDPRLWLFGNINIGFAIESYKSIAENSYFMTNLKWRLEAAIADSNEERRVKSVFLELLWLIKNKILLNEGDLNSTNIIWLTPQSMRRNTRNAFGKLWEDALKETFGETATISLQQESESVVPYFALQREFKFSDAEDALNIDIGGGTSDLLFLARSKGKYYSTSFRFAGNDIWGDGIMGGNSRDNGFLDYIKSQVNKGEIKFPNAETKNYYENAMSNTNFNSADVMSLIFKYDEVFRASKIFAAHSYLRTIFVLHYAAILYHVSQCVEQLGIEIPRYITFTGKGSSYIRLISPNHRDITELTTLLLSKFTNRQVADIEVKMSADPKTSTANGAVIKVATLNKSQQIKVEPAFDHYGYKGEMPLFHAVKEVTGDLQRKVEENVLEFLNVLFMDRDVVRFLKDFEISLTTEIHAALKKDISLNFNKMANDLRHSAKENDDLPETMFFWGLKNSLYRLSRELWGK